MKEQIIKKIDTNQETVGVIALGYVGLPLVVNFAEAGVDTLGFEYSISNIQKNAISTPVRFI